jgi:hypothetical protein
VRRLASLIFFVALATVAGCGSGDSTSATDAARSREGSLTKAQLIAKADAMCEASKAKWEPLQAKVEGVARKARGEEQGQGTVSDGTRKELAQTLGQIGAIAEADLSQLKALGLPEAEADQLEAIFQKSESAFRASRDYGAALENHEDAKAQTSAEAGNAETREVAVMAEQYGFKVCGSPPQE